MGEKTSLEVRITNAGSTPVEGRWAVHGFEPDWIDLPPKPFLLNPGEKRTVHLAIAIPSNRKIRPGDYEGSIEIHPIDLDGRLAESPCTIQILPTIDYQVNFSVSRLEVEQTGRFYLQLRNTGNDRVELQLGLDEEPLYFTAEFEESHIVLEPGQSRSVYLELVAQESALLGTRREDRLSVTVSLLGGLRSTQTFELEVVQKAALHGGRLRKVITRSLALLLLLIIGASAFKLLRPKPAELLRFEANPQEITAGDEVRLSWGVKNGKNLFIHPDIGPVKEIGQITLQPIVDTEYRIVQGQGEQETPLGSLFVDVTPPPPHIARFTVQPDTVQAGTPVILEWLVASADQLQIQPEVGEVPPQGSRSVLPVQSTEYELIASGEGGETRQTTSITVLPATSWTTLTATPGDIVQGESITLHWEAVGAKEVYVTAPAFESRRLSPAGSFQDRPTETRTYTFIAYPITEAGDVLTNEVQVVVSPPKPVEPIETTPPDRAETEPSERSTQQTQVTPDPVTPVQPPKPATVTIANPFPGQIFVNTQPQEIIRGLEPYSFQLNPGAHSIQLKGQWLDWETTLQLKPGEQLELQTQPRLLLPKGWALIPGGEFIMGTSRGEFDEGPERRITLPPYLLYKTTISNAEYEAVFPEHQRLRDSISPGDHHPVVQVSWAEAAEFCMRMSKKEGLPPAIDTTGNWMDVTSPGWRLPSEAEWECAARGGLIQMSFPWSDLPPGKDGVARCNHGSGNGLSRVADGFYGTAPVETFPPNAYGLFQMSGNVWEWCFDWYDTDTYLHEFTRFPLGARTGKSKVIRGGAFDYSYTDCTVFHRDWAQPEKTFNNTGFRPARSLPRELVRWLTTPRNELASNQPTAAGAGPR